MGYATVDATIKTNVTHTLVFINLIKYIILLILLLNYKFILNLHYSFELAMDVHLLASGNVETGYVKDFLVLESQLSLKELQTVIAKNIQFNVPETSDVDT